MRYAAKAVVVTVLYLVTWPAWVLAVLDQQWFGSERAFDFFAKLLSLVPGRIGQFLRTSFYMRTLASCHYDLMVGFGSFFSHPTAEVGRGVSIASFSIVGTAVIEDNVLIASRVSILSGKYHHGGGRNGPAGSSRVARYERVTIGHDSWVGEGCVVMADVGAQCILSAGSVITKPVPERSTAVGNPARFVRYEEKLSEDFDLKKTSLFGVR